MVVVVVMVQTTMIVVPVDLVDMVVQVDLVDHVCHHLGVACHPLGWMDHQAHMDLDMAHLMVPHMVLHTAPRMGLHTVPLMGLHMDPLMDHHMVPLMVLHMDLHMAPHMVHLMGHRDITDLQVVQAAFGDHHLQTCSGQCILGARAHRHQAQGDHHHVGPHLTWGLHLVMPHPGDLHPTWTQGPHLQDQNSCKGLHHMVVRLHMDHLHMEVSRLLHM